MRRLLLAAVMGLSLLTLGCQNQPAATVIAPDQTHDLGYRTTWLADLNLSAGANFARVELLGDKLVLLESAQRIEQSNRMVYAIDVADGQVAWRTILPGGREHPIGMARQQKQIQINSETRLYTLDIQSGQLVSMIPLAYATITGPAAYEGLNVFAGLNGFVYSQNAQGNFANWEYQLSDSIFAWPMLIQNTVFAIDRRGVMVLIDAKNGKLIWRRQPLGAVQGQPTSSGSAIFIPSPDNKLLCINRVSGRDVWTYRNEEGFKDGPIVVGNLALQTLVQSQNLIALEIASGKELWSVPGPVHSAIAHPKGILLAKRDALILIDAKTGQTIRQITTQPTQKMIDGPSDSILLIGVTGQIIRIDSL